MGPVNARKADVPEELPVGGWVVNRTIVVVVRRLPVLEGREALEIGVSGLPL